MKEPIIINADQLRFYMQNTITRNFMFEFNSYFGQHICTYLSKNVFHVAKAPIEFIIYHEIYKIHYKVQHTSHQDLDRRNKI